jgi:predicted DCC family thiol-disulfide oxidoreductase YuxK
MADQPTLIFDGDCGFCTTSVNQLRRYVEPECVILAWQHADLDELGVTAAQCRDAVQWVGPGGSHAVGGAAVAAVLLVGRAPWPVLGRFLSFGPVARVTDVCYRMIARNRYRLPGGTPACAIELRNPG